MNIFKKHPNLTIFSIILISLDIYHNELVLTYFVLYVLLINSLFEGVIKGKLRMIIVKASWTLFALGFTLVLYVDYFMPHSEWEKVLKTSESFMLLLALLFVAIVAGKKEDEFIQK